MVPGGSIAQRKHLWSSLSCPGFDSQCSRGFMLTRFINGTALLRIISGQCRNLVLLDSAIMENGSNFFAEFQAQVVIPGSGSRAWPTPTATLPSASEDLPPSWPPTARVPRACTTFLEWWTWATGSWRSRRRRRRHTSSARPEAQSLNFFPKTVSDPGAMDLRWKLRMKVTIL